METETACYEWTVCCEWCGEEFKLSEMATAELCQECVEVADTPN